MLLIGWWLEDDTLQKITTASNWQKASSSGALKLNFLLHVVAVASDVAMLNLTAAIYITTANKDLALQRLSAV